MAISWLVVDVWLAASEWEEQGGKIAQQNTEGTPGMPVLVGVWVHMNVVPDGIVQNLLQGRIPIGGTHRLSNRWLVNVVPTKGEVASRRMSCLDVIQHGRSFSFPVRSKCYNIGDMIAAVLVQRLRLSRGPEFHK